MLRSLTSVFGMGTGEKRVHAASQEVVDRILISQNKYSIKQPKQLL